MTKLIDCLSARRLAAGMAALWLATACSPGVSAQSNAFVPLVQGMADRLVIADQVALSKWDSGQSVYDPQREAQVLANAAAMAATYNVTAADASAIFADQIEANKEVQYALLNNWRRLAGAPATPRQSLTNVIRPELDALQVSILQNLQALAPLRASADCPLQVALAAGEVAQKNNLDGLHLAGLDRAVAQICRAS
ncbi:chorismate mutase [Paraburkholderia bonniea]|uniref:chorismate mutase n=1 Tax=Paraburkholderia bonniea TaxID=2152891 RepID=UPI0025737739|nr:chorismate mutase [Paraburkholderia bonniea]WJF90900.1 chorismate mutase [Paraburkholderia bonniea]WJF94214.1 chorismate mutase [Paraburkholderia bonniea]